MFEYPGGLLTLEDDLQTNAFLLIKFFLSKLKSSEYEIICVEKAPQKWKAMLGENIRTISFEHPQELRQFIMNLTNTSTTKKTLIIDSINQLSALIGWNICLEFLKQIKNRNGTKNTILICHNDCLLNGASTMIKHLQYVSQTYVKLKLQSPDSYQLDITNFPISGKTRKTVENIFYHVEGDKWMNAPVNKVLQNVEQDKINKSEQNIASFKISVDEAAQTIKDKMVLPYTEIVKSESKIIYHHDAEDDWDDEDPDDDLDI